MTKKYLFTLMITLFMSIGLFAQSSNLLNETMHSSGRIYVVITVIAIIFILLFIYLRNLDKRIGRIEQDD